MKRILFLVAFWASSTLATTMTTPLEEGATTATEETTPEEETTIPTTTATTSTSKATSTRRTTTSKPKPEFNQTEFQVGPFCTCDLTANSCDVGCCCDLDCSEADLKVFNGCDRGLVASTVNPRYCYTTQLLFANNSQVAVEKSNSDAFFCLLIDNKPEHYRLLDRKAVKNESQFDVLKSRHKRFKWPKPKNANDEEDLKTYKVDSPLLIKRNDEDEFDRFALPAPLNGFECNTLNPVRFARDKSAECRISGVIDCTKPAAFNLRHFVLDFGVASTPAPNAPIVDIRVFLKDFEGHWRESAVIPEPTSDCRNVLAALRYDIVHDEGEVKSVSAFAEFRHLKDRKNLVQKFSYRHFWPSDNATDVREKSGNPGYVVGKPLIFGRLKRAVEDAEDDESVLQEESSSIIEISSTSLSTMSLPRNGNCANDEDGRSAILFGQDVYVGCTFSVTRRSLVEKCDEIKNATFRLLVNGDLRGLKIASFGNSKANSPQDWTPLLYNEPDLSEDKGEEGFVCAGVFLSAHLEVAHAAVGSVANPQSKIVGAKFRLGPSRDLRFRCLGSACDLHNQSQKFEVSFRVSFIDVTAPALRRYAEFPKIEAKFPYDFFYPFISEVGDAEDDLAAPGSSKASSTPKKLSTFVIFVTLMLHFLACSVLKWTY